MPTRSEGAREVSSRVAALRTQTTSSLSISVSSNTTATNRWGRAAMASGVSPDPLASALGSAGFVVGAILWESGVSVLKVEIT